MSELRCATIGRWVATGQPAAAPSAPLVEHVVGCPTCQGALALLAAELMIGPPAAALACGTCQELLPALLDHEQAMGLAAAARQLPAVWWHLWSCAACASTYQLMGALLVAEGAGQLRPLPTAPQAVQPPKLRLERSFLQGLFGPQLSMGAAWDGGGEAMLLAEERSATLLISLAVRQRAAAQWDFVIRVEPPVVGHVLLTLGELAYQAALSPQGEATIEAVQARLLAAAEGPDMVLSIHYEGHDGLD